MSIITITSRDQNCKNCKLTIQIETIVTPSWFGRLFLGAQPEVTTITETWYGSDKVWESGPTGREKMPRERAMFFSKMWESHLAEKRKEGIIGTYRTVIDSNGRKEVDQKKVIRMR